MESSAETPLATPISEPTSPDEVGAAEQLGGSVRALRIHLAAGAIPIGHWEEYHETVDSLAAVGNAFGVSERTAASWKAKGMPVAEDGKYVIAAIRRWRLQQPNPEEWLFTGSSELPARDASGDLARGILRWIRTEMRMAACKARDDFLVALDTVDVSDREAVSFAFIAALARHMEAYRLSDSEIEELLAETWGLV